mmetsp:Transcript_91384/g.197681  ORF Transcript_91384/g.197681 Transcript_91384/m.197681 type:complete len:155 (-) Transcript_91384:481-945(-)
MTYIHIKIISASDLVSTQWFKSDDPYVKIIGKSMAGRRTRTIESGGSDPVWDEQIEKFKLHPRLKSLEFVVMNDNAITEHYLMGSATVSNLLEMPNNDPLMLTLPLTTSEGEKQGSLKIEIELRPDDRNHNLNDKDNQSQNQNQNQFDQEFQNV